MRPASRRKARRRRARGIVCLDLLLAAAAFGGLLLAMRPVIDDTRSTSEAREVIASMTAQADETNNATRMDILRQAQRYNAGLVHEAFVVDNEDLGGSSGGTDDILNLSEEEQDRAVDSYEQQLHWRGYPAMCWVEIPAIGVQEPVFHGTSDEALAQGVGHLETSSLPVGGTPSNCIFAAHSGMQDKSMFDNLDHLHTGDVIIIHTLGDAYQYEVYSSEVLTPREAAQRCAVIDGDDECTLMTCTPYGVNSHRLLVHARRVAYTVQEKEDTLPTLVTTMRSDATGRRVRPLLIASMGLIVPLMLVGVSHLARRIRHLRISRGVTSCATLPKTKEAHSLARACGWRAAPHCGNRTEPRASCNECGVCDPCRAGCL